MDEDGRMLKGYEMLRLGEKKIPKEATGMILPSAKASILQFKIMIEGGEGALGGGKK